jgi:hypothetical protein
MPQHDEGSWYDGTAKGVNMAVIRSSGREQRHFAIPVT